MKKITLVLVCLIYILINKSYASNDSLVIINDTLKETNLTTEEEALVNEEEKTEATAPTVIEKKVNIKQSKLRDKKPLYKPQGFGDFIGGLMDLISQLWKPVWGYYKEDNMRKEGPYFLFMNTDNGNAFIKKQMTDLRIKIKILESTEYKIYDEIFKLAGTTTIDNCNGVIIPNPIDGSAMCGAAARAKASAFVFLIGLDGNGNPLDNGSSTTGRNAFRDKALNAFENLDGEIDGNAVTPWTYAIPVYGPVILSYNVYNREVEFYSKMQGFTRSLIMWLQAYDLLKASAALPELNGRSWHYNFYSDRNSGDCSPRNKLRKYTRDIYKYSEGDFGITEHALGWKKNHGIAAASAVLMAAQVLNDAGVDTNYLTGLFGWLWGDGFNIPRPIIAVKKIINHKYLLLLNL